MTVPFGPGGDLMVSQNHNTNFDTFGSARSIQLDTEDSHTRDGCPTLGHQGKIFLMGNDNKRVLTLEAIIFLMVCGEP
jgi:hypothetical protein